MRTERGSVAVEFALVAPALMLLVLALVQFGLWYHAQNVVQTAALEGARVAAAEDGTAGGGRLRALEVLRAGVGQTVQMKEVSAAVELDAARVEVTAELPGLLPIPTLSSFSLASEATAFRERFRSAAEG